MTITTSTAAPGQMPAGFDLASHLRRIAQVGYTVVPDALDPATVAAAIGALDPLLGRHRGRNDFEGFQTERIYTLINHGKVFEDICENPVVVAVLDALLKPGYLLSVTQAIGMLPGETPQAFHRDDGYYPSHPAVLPHSVSTMFALDPFTMVNGATEMVPGSHAWPPERSAALRGASDAQLASEPPPMEKVLMAPGSCAIWVGSTMHRGGANRSDAIRRSITNQYCNPWLRPQETLLLSVPRDKARRMSPRLQTMLGYDVLMPFMGHLTGLHPRRALQRGD